MELNKGLWRDSRDSKVPLGAWVQAKNILLSQKFRSIVAEPGFSTIADIEGNIIGTIVCPDYVIHHVKLHTKDKIVKVFPNGTVTTIVDTSIHTLINLNYRLDKPIEGIFKVNNKGEVIICWTDNYNPIRILNVDTVTTSLTTNDLIFYPQINSDITYSISIDETSGSLLVGKYNIVCRFITSLGTETDWLNISKPIFITKSSLSDGYNNYSGAESGQGSTKRIVAVCSNIDTNFDKIQYGVISTINGIVSFKIAKEEKITSSSHTFKYTGLENIDDTISINEVLIPSIKYKTCKTLTQVNKRLCIGNATTSEDFNYQKYANNIKINYLTENKNVTSLSAGSSTGSSKIIQLNHTDRSFMHREVYSFYIGFKLRKGGYSKLYHIPGRRAVSGETSISALSGTGFATNPKVFQIQDTCDAVGATTNMGYWQNESEFYPSAANDPNGDYEVWDNTGKIDDIQGENVRHHRMPSIDYIMSLSLYGTNYRKTDADILGIEISDVYIPDEIKDEILGWEIFYAERDYNNCTILGQDFLVQAITTSGGTKRFSGGLNYTYSDSLFPTAKLDTSLGKYIQSRCPDILKDKPSNTPNYVALELHYKLATTRLRSISGVGGFEFENTIVDYTGLYSIADTVTIQRANAVVGTNIREVNNAQYVASNTFQTNIENRLGDEYLELELDGAIISPNDWEINSLSNAIPDHDSVLYSLCQLKDNIYDNHNTYTKFVSTGITFDANTTSGTNIFSGDIFIVDNCSVRYAIGTEDPFLTTNNMEGLHHIIRGILNCVNNWSLRHVDEYDVHSYYYPKISSFPPLNGFANYDKNNPINVLYNTDFTGINNKNIVFPFNYLDNDTTSLPFLIARATAVSDETNLVSWGKFLANDYYTMPRHKGEVWKLEEMGTSLLINQKNSFHVARLKDKLANDINEIFVGTGDVFDRPPQENIPTPLGYAGCQSQFGTCVTKHGYVFIDAQQGKVFLYNGNLIELSNKGNHDWFFEMLPLAGTTDNPYTQNGISCTFDEEFNRLIIGVRHSSILGGPYPLLDLSVIYNVGDIISDGVNLYIVVDSKVKPDINYYPEDLQIDVLGSTEVGYAEKILYNDPQYYNSSKCFTISYSFDYQCWVCEHDYLPNFMYYTRSGAYSINTLTSSKIFKFNESKHRGLYYTSATTYPSSIDVSFMFKEQVILNSVKWKNDIYLDITGNEKWIEDETVDAIAIYNKSQCSGLIVLSDKSPSRYANTLRRNVKGLWSFNNFRDIVINHNSPFIDTKGNFITANLNSNQIYYKLLPLINDYFIVKFVYNNTYNTFKEWYLNDIDLLITPTKNR